MLRTEDCMFVSNGVEGCGTSDCEDYAHQTNGETKKLVYDNKDRIGKANAYKKARDIVLDAWQHDWDRAKKGRWTRRLIGQIRPCIEREHVKLLHDAVPHRTRVLSRLSLQDR